MSRATNHKIADYRAKEDIVLCVCEFVGTVEEFRGHKTKSGKAPKEVSLSNNYDYPVQGSLTGTGKSYGK